LHGSYGGDVVDAAFDFNTMFSGMSKVKDP
jgi:peptidylprolyl isomerase